MFAQLSELLAGHKKAKCIVRLWDSRADLKKTYVGVDRVYLDGNIDNNTFVLTLEDCQSERVINENLFCPIVYVSTQIGVTSNLEIVG